MFFMNMDENKSKCFLIFLEIATVVLAMSLLFYIVGVFLFLDKAFLLMANVSIFIKYTYSHISKYQNSYYS